MGTSTLPRRHMVLSKRSSVGTLEFIKLLTHSEPTAVIVLKVSTVQNQVVCLGVVKACAMDSLCYGLSVLFC